MAQPARFTFDLDLEPRSSARRPAPAPVPSIPEDVVAQLIANAREEAYAEGLKAGEQNAASMATQTIAAAAGTLATGIRVKGDRLAILTNGGGIGVLAVDALAAANGHLAELAETTLARLNEVLPEAWSHANPVDILGDAPGRRYALALEALLDERGADAILVMNCPAAVVDSLDAARAVVETIGTRQAAVLTCWLG